MTTTAMDLEKNKKLEELTARLDHVSILVAKNIEYYIADKFKKEVKSFGDALGKTRKSTAKAQESVLINAIFFVLKRVFEMSFDAFVFGNISVVLPKILLNICGKFIINEGDGSNKSAENIAKNALEFFLIKQAVLDPTKKFLVENFKNFIADKSQNNKIAIEKLLTSRDDAAVKFQNSLLAIQNHDKADKDVENVIKNILNGAIKDLYKNYSYLFCANVVDGKVIISDIQDSEYKFLEQHDVVVDLITEDHTKVGSKIHYLENVLGVLQQSTQTDKIIKAKLVVQDLLREWQTSLALLSVNKSKLLKSFNNKVTSLITNDDVCNTINQAVCDCNFVYKNPRTKKEEILPLLKDDKENWMMLKLRYAMKHNPGDVLSNILLDTNIKGGVAEKNLDFLFKPEVIGGIAMSCDNIEQVVGYGKNLINTIKGLYRLRLYVNKKELLSMAEDVQMTKNTKMWLHNLVSLSEKQKDHKDIFESAIEELNKTQKQREYLKTDQDIVDGVNSLVYLVNKLDAKDTSLKNNSLKRCKYISEVSSSKSKVDCRFKAILSFEVNKRNDAVESKLGNVYNKIFQENYIGAGVREGVEKIASNDDEAKIFTNKQIGSQPPKIISTKFTNYERNIQYLKYLALIRQVTEEMIEIAKSNKRVNGSKELIENAEKFLTKFNDIRRSLALMENVEKKFDDLPSSMDKLPLYKDMIIFKNNLRGNKFLYKLGLAFSKLIEFFKKVLIYFHFFKKNKTPIKHNDVEILKEEFKKLKLTIKLINKDKMAKSRYIDLRKRFGNEKTISKNNVIELSLKK